MLFYFLQNFYDAFKKACKVEFIIFHFSQSFLSAEAKEWLKNQGLFRRFLGPRFSNWIVHQSNVLWWGLTNSRW